MRKFLRWLPNKLSDSNICFRMGRRKRHSNRNQKQHVPYKNERNYTQTEKDNKLFLEYYSNLGLMPENEVQDFYNQMKEPLPVTFRITGYKSQANVLMKIIRTQFFDSLIGSDKPSDDTSADSTSTENTGTSVSVSGDDIGTALPTTELGDVKGSGDDAANSLTSSLTKATIRPPKCLSWYPGGLAWQIDLSRKAVRSQVILSKLHEFLVSETESGNISRQEAVSMIPPIVLDVQPNSRVLDLCAAPGSKTAQLIEYLHKDENGVPEGVVVANDRDNKRCYLMVHQVKRLNSPCCMVVNHDASLFPKLRISSNDSKPEFMLFDRVLADVPCSGDGTMRKNIDIWSKWQPMMGNAMHGLQLKIVKRGLELLEVGGRLVYSTCSMQPVEDEAVIAETLRKCQGTVELVDISSYLPGFKTVPGLSTWKLMNKAGHWISDFESVPENFKTQFNKTMFSPTPEEAEKFNLHLCHRVLPHHQDTGGFFVAALQKVTHLPWSREARLEKEEAARQSEAKVEATEPSTLSTAPADKAETEAEMPGSSAATADSVTEPPAVTDAQDSTAVTNGDSKKRKGMTEEGPVMKKKKEMTGYREDPFIFMKPDDPVWPPIRDFYGLTDNFPSNQLLYRSEQGANRSLYFVSRALRQIVLCNDDRVRFINMGVKFVSRSPSPLVPDCDFRLTQECMGSLSGLLGKRTVSITKDDATVLFREENPYLSKMCESTMKILEEKSPGSLVFVYRPTESEPDPACVVIFCGWRGKTSVRSFVPRFERSHCLRLFGQDASQIKAEVAQMKAERQQKFDEATALAAQEATKGKEEDESVQGEEKGAEEERAEGKGVEMEEMETESIDNGAEGELKE